MASYMCTKAVNRINHAIKLAKNVASSNAILTKQAQVISITCRAGYASRRQVANAHELYIRRIKAGPEPVRHPSKYGCWNYESELYAFGKRYGEEFDESLLKAAFTERSYVEEEQQKREELGVGIDLTPLQVQDNEELAKKGSLLMSRFIKAYLRYSYPHMFEEGICAVHDYLMSDTVLCNVTSNHGFKDLIMSPEYPPMAESFVRCFKAVVGALAESQTVERAELFVRDLVLVELIGKDINEIWEVVNPMGLLTSILQAQGRQPPEPRLLWSSASETVMSVYHVGIYCDKQLIGKSPGETVLIAEEMAAREAIRNILNTADHRKPLNFATMKERIELDYDRTNVSVEELSSVKLKEIESNA